MPRLHDRPYLERFLSKFMPEPNSGCWLWTAATFKTGYGMFTKMPNESDKGRLWPFLAHRLSWEHFRGPIPEGMCVLHKCDVRSCVNPDHLFLGTYADNGADMVAKGRSARGVKNPKAKLTEAQVLAIRADPRSRRKIAPEYGVSGWTVSMIKRGDKWKHLEADDA